jgi:hypothetical protein
MIYRTNASELSDEEVRCDAEELELLRSAARTRRRRAAIAISVVVLGGATSVVALTALSPPQQSLRCHHVQIAWENAPEVPGPGWTACAWR